MPGPIITPTLPAQMPAVNVTAISMALSAVTSAYRLGDTALVKQTLGTLRELVAPLDDGARHAEDLHRICSGRGSPSREDLHRAITGISRSLQSYTTIISRGTEAQVVPITPPRKVVPAGLGLRIASRPSALYVPRNYQRDIVRAAVRFFSGTDSETGRPNNKGMLVLHTGLGKSVTYAYVAGALKKELPRIFGDIVIITGCHRYKPAVDLAHEIKDVLPSEEVVFLEGDVDRDDLKGVTIVVGTYHQLAQEPTVELLKQWVGRRRVLFILDEADMVVHKGIHVKRVATRDDDANDVFEIDGQSYIIDEQTWHPSWFKPYQEFGLFDNNGRERPHTRHYMLGGTATPYRPDGISLSTVWRPGSVFYYVPMGGFVRDGYLVKSTGNLVEMDVPEDVDIESSDAVPYGRFLKVTRQGKMVVDREAVSAAAGSDYAVKTAVRSMLDNMWLTTGVGSSTGKDVRYGIGFANDSPQLEKHMRWQQELFELVELIFNIQNGLNSPRPMHVNTLLHRLGGAQNLDAFAKTIKRFLYGREYKDIKGTLGNAAAALKEEKIDSSVKELFSKLYVILNVDLRRIKGRPLVATAVWMGMERDNRDRKIPADPAGDPGHYPNPKWPNKFGGRRQTELAFQRADGSIDVLWNIDILGRGYNSPMASLLVDNAPSHSCRAVVQRIGRVLRPPDGRSPKDHSRKPDARIITVTPNVTVHNLDPDRMDLARAFGTEMHPELRFVKIDGTSTGGGLWRTPDSVQLDMKGSTPVTLVRIGARTSKRVKAFLKHRYADPDDLTNRGIIAIDAGASVAEIDYLLGAKNLPKDSRLRSWLKKWGADNETIEEIMTEYHTDVAELKTMSGPGWRVIHKGAR